jgi:hypothetical protein
VQHNLYARQGGWLLHLTCLTVLHVQEIQQQQQQLAQYTSSYRAFQVQRLAHSLKCMCSSLLQQSPLAGVQGNASPPQGLPHAGTMLTTGPVTLQLC